MIDESIVLVDEEGTEHKFTFYDTIDIEDSRYAILIPNDSEEGDEAVIFRIESEDEETDEVILVPVSDEDEIDTVVAALEELEEAEEEE